MADNEKRDYSLIGYMENLSDNVKHFVQNHSIGKALVVAAALSIPSNVFIQQAEASRIIEQDSMHYGIMRDVNDLGLPETSFGDLPQFDVTVNEVGGQEIAPAVMSLSAVQFAELEKIAEPDVIVPDNSNQNGNIGLMSTDGSHVSSVDFEKAAHEFNYDLNSKMFVTDRADLKEFNGNGSYVYFPVRSSGKNDDVKAYVQDPHELRHNDYNMGRNESRDNPEYGFKRQKDMQRIAALSGREYKPSILNDQEFDEFKQVFGKLDQQNARFVPIFSSHPKFSQYKVEFSADLNLSSIQADYLLKNYSNRFTSDVREDLKVKSQGMSLGNEEQQPELSLIAYKADSSKFLADGNGYGLAKVNVEFEAENEKEALKLGKIYALKDLNNNGRIINGMVTSLDAANLVQHENGKYSLDVTVGGVLAPNAVRESTNEIYADRISVGLETWDEAGRQVYTADKLKSDLNIMKDTPDLKTNMINMLDNLNSELRDVDFTVDSKIKDSHDQEILKNQVSRQDKLMEELRSDKVQEFDSSKFISNGNGYGTAKVKVELEAGNMKEALRLGKIEALKGLNKDGRIVDGMVTSLDAANLVQHENGKYTLDVTVGGVLAPDSANKISDIVPAEKISVGLEVVEDGKRHVYGLDELMKNSNIISENPELRNSMIETLNNVNAELKGVDFTNDKKSVENQSVDIPKYDSKPVVEMSNKLADISDKCILDLKAEQIAQKNLKEFNEKYNSGSFIKDNFNRLRDGLTGNAFKEKQQQLSNEVNKASNTADNSIGAFYSTCKEIESISKGLDYNKVASKGNVLKNALKHGKLGVLKEVSKEFKQELNVYKDAAVSLGVKTERLADIASSKSSVLMPGMSASECYKVLAKQELVQSSDSSFKIPDQKIVDVMLKSGFTVDNVKDALDTYSPNFVKKGVESKILVENSKKQIINKENAKANISRSANVKPDKSRDSDMSR